jgi:hypothetical protein
MKTNVTASTEATLENLVRICNRFFAKNPLQYAINDLAFWICKKVNPHYFRNEDARTLRMGDSVVSVFKGLLRFYQLGIDGQFLYENQFGSNLWIRTNLAEIKRLCKKPFTPDQWRYAKKALTSSGILKIKQVSIDYGSFLLLQIDFSQLEAILEQLPQLKKQRPTIDNWPLPSTVVPVGEHPNSIIHTLVEISVASSLSSPVASSAEEKKTLSGGEVLSEDTGEFANAEFDGKLDPEGEMILDLLRQIFPVTITNGHIRQIKALRHRKHNFGQMTFARVGQYFEITKGESPLPTWMMTDDLSFFLEPGPWVSIVREMELLAYSDVAEDIDTLSEIPGYKMELQSELQILRDSPDTFWSDIIETEKLYHHRPWLMLALYGQRVGWEPELMDKTVIEAKAIIMKKAIWFVETDAAAGWSSLLRMTPGEVESLQKQAAAQLRMMKWRVFQAKEAGAI